MYPTHAKRHFQQNPCATRLYHFHQKSSSLLQEWQIEENSPVISHNKSSCAQTVPQKIVVPVEKKRRIPPGTHSTSKGQGQVKPQPIIGSIPRPSSEKKKKPRMTPRKLNESMRPQKHQPKTSEPYETNDRKRKIVIHPSTPLSEEIQITSEPHESSQGKSPKLRCMAHMWRHTCPISGCLNIGKRGYARSTFVDLPNTHRIFLTNEIELARALQATTTFGDLRCCGLCC